MLNRIKSNLSFEERERLNQNWNIIENYLSGLQGQITKLTNGVDVQALIDQINDILNRGNDVVGDLESALQDVTAVINNVQNATDDANNAAQNALNAIADIQSIISDFGSKGVYNDTTTYKRNNIAYKDGCSYIYINDTPSSGNPPPPYPTISNAHWHILADKGASGSGAVSKVNGKEPNGSGEITLEPSDIGAASSTDLTTLDNKVTEHLDDFISVSRFGLFKDSTTIQNALNYAKSIGGAIVIVPAGTYNVLDIIKVPSNVKLIGQGDVVFKRAAEINAITINDSDGTIGGYNANKNITIRGIKFDGNSTEISTHFTNLVFGHCTNVEIDSCEFYDCASHHEIELNACKDSVIKNNLFRDYRGITEVVQLDYAGSFAAFPWFGPFDDTPCQNITIENNRFIGVGNTYRAIGNHTFKAGVYTNYLTIKNNYFEGFNETISMQDTINMSILDNTFVNCRCAVWHEEKLNDVNDWIMRGNKFYGGYLSGSEQRFLYGGQTVLTKAFYNIIIEQNEIYNCWTHGIACTFGGSVRIANNFINSCGKNAIFVFGGSRLVITNNICTNNNRQNETTRADIVIGGNANLASSGIIVSGNNINTCIVGTNSDNVVVTDNIVTDFLTNNAGAGAILKNNLIANTWTP